MALQALKCPEIYQGDEIPDGNVTGYHSTLALAMAHMCDVRALALYRFVELDDEHLAPLASRSTQLQTLQLADRLLFEHTADLCDAVIAIVERNPLLEQMSVMGSKWLRDDQVTAIATSCPLLRLSLTQLS
jgi:hypothetical protein